MIITDEGNAELYKEVKEIKTSFPEKKYLKLLNLCNLNKNSPLGHHQMSQIFVNAIYRFLIGQFSQDELSSIAGHLWNEVDSEEKFRELGSALYECSELSYYIRRIYDPKRPGKYGNFTSFMKKVMKYYETHKIQVVLDTSAKK